MTSSAREYAQRLAVLGAVVFPVSLWIKPDGKKGVSAPTAWDTYQMTAETFAEIERTGAYGIDCGRSGLDVVDLDRKPDVDGVSYWDGLGYPRSPFEVTTQAGGRHMVFRALESAARTGSLPKIGVDVRGEGGMVFGPGSVVTGGGTYTALALPSSFVELPSFPAEAIAECRTENAALVRAAAGARHPEAFVTYPATASAVERCRLDVERDWALLEESVGGGFNDALLRVLCSSARWFAARNGMEDEEGPFTVDDARQFVVDRMLESDVMGPPDGSDEQTIHRSRTVEQAFTEPSHHLTSGPSEAELDWSDMIQVEVGPAYTPQVTIVPDSPGQSRAAGDKVTEMRQRLLSVRQLADLPRPKWLVHHLMPAASIVRLNGNPGSYKSFLALDIALSVATGRNWQGWNTRQGAVIYVAGEGASGYQDRIAAWQRYHGVNHVPDEAFQLYPDTILTNSEDWETFTTIVEEDRPALVVLDTQQRVTAGVEENSASEMAVVIGRWDWLAKRGATVLVVHHLGKDSSRGGRGSSAVNASVNAEFVLRREEGSSLVVLETTKQKDAPEAAPMELVAETIRLNPHDAFAKVIPIPETSLVLRMATSADRVATDGTFERQVLEAVGRVAPAEGGVVSLSSLRYELEIGDNDGAGKKRLQRALATLVEAGKLAREGAARTARFALPAVAA